MNMKNSHIRQQMAARTGKLILSFYQLYTKLFVRKEDFQLPHPPVRHREIILIRKTGHGYRAMADVVSLS
ncbi:hypothetical protein [Paraflavitalea pollutisoli]|uniref:hypothetical protein n=1 Tax=Paraflavitalea pollutisoli TaxID=3034143 RepID=UPI0023EDC0CC|nr:hypothetical protein [Paraflavitalea sp. H1-2-19X]